MGDEHSMGGPVPQRPALSRKKHLMSGPIANPGGRERVVDRAATAFQMRKEGRTNKSIAEHFGVSEHTIGKDIRGIVEELREDALALAAEERDIMAGQCRQIIAKFAPVVLNADVAIMLDRDGKPVLNADRIDAISKAAAVILKAQERLAKLYGTDAPERVITDTTNRFVGDEELADRVEEKSALVAALGNRVDSYRRRGGNAEPVDADAVEIPRSDVT